ncbi:exosome complex protein Rrp4 [Candidatus Woesearchaeota archaeon]|nr:exosome complex protein Rrp4 [Candidatus Woesearchaeota archaeon]MBW2994501.1 exosome complex protein Rrp4 [Candidatus Woesearchaeota archaeon]
MTDKLNIKNKEIAVPGEVLAEGMGYVPSRGIRRVQDKLIAEQLGMISVEGKVIKLIPLTGVYLPKVNDKIICKVIDVLMTGWRLDTRSPYSAVLSMKDATSEFIQRGADLTQFFAIGDYVLTKIVNITSQKLVDVSMKGPGLRKLRGGRIIKVNPHKVPRVIGKEGSMVILIKQATGCNVMVGQNGLIWIDGEPEAEVIAEKAILKINAEAHLPGLTDRIKEFLDKSGLKSKAAPAGEKKSTATAVKKKIVTGGKK